MDTTIDTNLPIELHNDILAEAAKPNFLLTLLTMAFDTINIERNPNPPFPLSADDADDVYKSHRVYVDQGATYLTNNIEFSNYTFDTDPDSSPNRNAFSDITIYIEVQWVRGYDFDADPDYEPFIEIHYTF